MPADHLHRDPVTFVRNATLLDAETLEQTGRTFKAIEHDPDLTPRQREEIRRLITRIAFELVCRDREAGDAERP